MKTLGLLFSLLVLSVFGLLLLFVGFTGHFNPEDFLYYLVGAAIVFFIVRAVGGSLDKQFNCEVRNFLDGKSEVLSLRKGLRRVFGLLLLTLLPFLIYLQLFALYSAITFAVTGLALLGKLDSAPVVIIIGLIIVAIGTLIAVVVGFYQLLFPPRREQQGVILSESADPVLWSVVRDVAKRMATKPVDQIIVTAGSGIGVYQDGSLLKSLLGRGRRTLEIGLPVIYGLTSEEFKAILAHEYGHFSHRDTQWGSFTYSMGNSLINTLQRMPGPSRYGGRSGIVALIMHLNPAYWTLLIFTNLYFKITSGFSRVREVMADLAAIRMYGGCAFGNGLLKVAVNVDVLGERLPEQAGSIYLNDAKIDGFWQLVESAYAEASESDIAEARQRVLAEGETHGIFGRHPAVGVRLGYADRIGGEVAENSEPATNIFGAWDKINSLLADKFNRRVFSFEPVARPVSTQPTTAQTACSSDPSSATHFPVGTIEAQRSTTAKNTHAKLPISVQLMKFLFVAVVVVAIAGLKDWQSTGRLFAWTRLSPLPALIVVELVLVSLLGMSIKKLFEHCCFDDIQFVPVDPASYRWLNHAKLQQWTEEIEALGFVKQQDFTMVSGSPLMPSGIARIFMHPEQLCIAEINQVCPKTGNPGIVGCVFGSRFEDGWTLNVTGRPPMAESYPFRRQRKLWASHPGKSPTDLFSLFLERRRKLVEDLGLRIDPDVSAERYFTEEKNNLAAKKELIHRRFIGLALLEMLLFSLSPKFEWNGEYAKKIATEHRG